MSTHDTARSQVLYIVCQWEEMFFYKYYNPDLTVFSPENLIDAIKNKTFTM